MERDPTSIEAAIDKDSESSDFFHSFHVHTFFIDGWCDPWSDHGVAATHGWLPWHIHWWVISGEHLCPPYCSMAGSPSPSPEALEDEDDDGDFDDDDDDKDDDASSPSDYKMTAWVTCPLSFVTKRGSSFGYESSHVHRGRVSIGDFC